MGFSFGWLFSFCNEKLQSFDFAVCRRLQFFPFLAFGFQFSATTQAVFRIWCPMWFSVFLFIFSVSSFFVFCLHAMTLLRGMHDKPEWPYRVVALLKSNYAWDHHLTKNHRGYRGKKWESKLRMKVKRQLWTVPLSYEEGKGGRILGWWINSGVNSTRKSEACKSLKNLFG